MLVYTISDIIGLVFLGLFLAMVSILGIVQLSLKIIDVYENRKRKKNND
ncbi:hypothetical protein UFOVP23_14 [uncultured Caudovirales phage]|uniref:Uncharacterized protein n=1 Tax=uncultured Caudovirales phage TaxID=2100421 RepID=A0A6J5TBA3_9CAUD|nr:hypothetical protein UFOVP23_14 [uncultured Caudovirales phage]